LILVVRNVFFIDVFCSKIQKKMIFILFPVNWFGLKGVEYIANALEINTTLTRIDLSSI